MKLLLRLFIFKKGLVLDVILVVFYFDFVGSKMFLSVVFCFIWWICEEIVRFD